MLALQSQGLVGSSEAMEDLKTGSLNPSMLSALECILLANFSISTIPKRCVCAAPVRTLRNTSWAPGLAAAGAKIYLAASYQPLAFTEPIKVLYQNKALLIGNPEHPAL